MLKYLLLAGVAFLAYSALKKDDTALEQRSYLGKTYAELVPVLPRMSDAEVADVYALLTRYNSLSAIPATPEGNALRDRLVAIGLKYQIFS